MRYGKSYFIRVSITALSSDSHLSHAEVPAVMCLMIKIIFLFSLLFSVIKPEGEGVVVELSEAESGV